jgi:uncharacterized repeat protein (TIGR03803 family)
MITRQFKTSVLAVGIQVLMLISLPVGAGTTVTNLFSFQNLQTGEDPRFGLVLATNGAYYGTTSGGGPYDSGTVFKMSADGTVTTVLIFNGTNGSGPYGGLRLASDGNLYGTTMDGGGSNGSGTIFRIGPDDAFTNLITFAGTNGQMPSTGLTQGRDGNLYGTTDLGGVYGIGTAFRMTLDGTLTTLVSFDGTNGSDPMGGLVQASDGNFYGTTREGGDIGYGSLFRLTPAGALTPLASFNYTNGCWPAAGLMQAADGCLYGTTCGFLTANYGTAFRITTNGVLSTLVFFNQTNGGSPLAALMQANDGNLYGTTTSGGAYNRGTVFRLTPSGAFSTVYSFTGTNDGIHPSTKLIQGADGDLYGMTSEGGAYNSGNIFRLSIPMAPMLLSPVVMDNAVLLNWNAVAGQSYQTEFCSDLSSSNWVLLGFAVTATNGALSARDSRSPDLQRFYRVVVLP